METLAQSVSTIAPTATPVVTIPLVCALAGNGTWLAYVLATIAILLVAVCVSRYARHSSSPGSLYTYVSKTLPRPLSAVAAWSLLLAYVTTGSSVIGGFYHYANLLLHDASGHITSAAALAILVTVISAAIAWRDVKVSARLMLWIEASSVTLILILVAILLIRHGAHLDLLQLHLQGMTGSGLRLGLVLALFSFVRIRKRHNARRSSARNPLKNNPAWPLFKARILSGCIFIVCSYAEVLGFRTAGQNLGDSQAPMRVLAHVAGAPILGLLIDIGALVSLFACTLACITAAARVLLLMSHGGLAHEALRKTHLRFETPGRAILTTGIAAVAPTAILAAGGASGLDVYGWMGSLAAYGFMVTYGLVSFALPRYLKDHGVVSSTPHFIPWLACAAMALALVGNLYPVPEGPYGKLPYIYIGYLSIGMVWFFISNRRNPRPA